MPECIDSSVGVWASSARRNMLDWSIAGTERIPRKLEAPPNLSPGVCNYIVLSINFNSTSAITLSSVLTLIRAFIQRWRLGMKLRKFDKLTLFLSISFGILRQEKVKF